MTIEWLECWIGEICIHSPGGAAVESDQDIER